MSRPAFVAALLVLLYTTAPLACPALPPGAPLPIDARAAPHEDPSWRARHALLERQMASNGLGKVRLLFLGDSLTEGWSPLLYQQFYGHRAALNLGVSGDTTHTLLWRLTQSPLGTTLRPQAIVLLIGTNNLWPGRSANDIAIGVATVLRLIRQRSPNSRVLLVGLLPRGPTSADPLRQLAEQVNPLIAGCADGKMVFYTDPGRMLLDGQGNLSDQMAFDYLHLSWMGYAVLAAGLEPHIRQILRQP